MRISIVGYGKLGNAIANIATFKGYDVIHKINSNNLTEISSINLENTDVVIDCSTPNSVVSNLEKLIPKGLPLVVATTGWYDRLGDIEELTTKFNTGFIYAANFSIGVNILFRLNRMLSTIMNRFPNYDCFIEERHHRYKQDAPSGTALRLAHELITDLDRKVIISDQGSLLNKAPKQDELCVTSIRSGEIIGEHSVVFTSEIDEITISHKALKRDGFALGVILAAEWIKDKKGFYEFNETLI